MSRALAVAAALAAAGGCRCGPRRAAAPPSDAPAPPADGPAPRAAPAGDDPAWAALDGLAPRAHPRWAAALPERLAPAIDAHGPVIAGATVVVAGSTIGVAGLDLARGELRWHRPTTGRVARPAPLGDHLVAVGDCTYPVDPPAGHAVIGCYEVLDRVRPAVWGAGSIVAPVADAALGGGPTRLVVDGRVAWLGRADGWVRAALPDPARGEVRAAAADRRAAPPAADEPRLAIGDGDRRIDLWVADDVLELRHHDPEAVSSRSALRAIAGAPGALHPLGGDEVRAVRLVDGEAALRPVRLDARALVVEEAGPAVPGIALLAAAHGERGFAIAVRLDTSLVRDYVAAFRLDGALAWVYPLPPPPGPGRALPVGLALAGDAVVVFHDGTTVAALPGP